MTKRLGRLLGALAVIGGGLGLSAHAQAVEYLGTFSGNDCGAGGFSNCYAYPGGTHQGPIELGSPVVFKHGSDGEQEVSSLFPSVDGSEFVVNLVNNVLSFSYTAGTGDPDLHYFTIKQAKGFALFYDAAPITSASINLGTYFPKNPGYSHISFFNTGSTPAVPEPATWALLLAGFFGIGGALRSMKRREKLTVSYV